MLLSPRGLVLTDSCFKSKWGLICTGGSKQRKPCSLLKSGDTITLTSSKHLDSVLVHDSIPALSNPELQIDYYSNLLHVCVCLLLLVQASSVWLCLATYVCLCAFNWVTHPANTMKKSKRFQVSPR